MHLLNVTPFLSDGEKSFRARIWHSTLSLERVVTIMTGRPSMVRDEDCSVALPSADLEEPDGPNAKPRRHASRSLFSPSRLQSPVDTPVIPSDMSHATAYFIYYAELNAIAQLVAGKLYNAKIRDLKWIDIHRRIEDLDGNLLRWAATLPRVFDFRVPLSDQQNKPYRTALGIIFNSTRMIINRPCLCHLDRKIANQSDASRDANQASANRCVESAKAIIELVSDEANLEEIYSGPLWWMLHHHLQRAITVLLLEVSFRASSASDIPAEADELLTYATEAIGWLRLMATFSDAARNTWNTLSHLLQLTAHKVGGDTADRIIAEDLWRAPASSQPMTPTHPRTWRPDHPDGTLDHQGMSFDDLVSLEFDEFGFLRDPQALNLFFPAEEDGEGDDRMDGAGGQD